MFILHLPIYKTEEEANAAFNKYLPTMQKLGLPAEVMNVQHLLRDTDEK